MPSHPPAAFTREALAGAGFVGWRTWDALRSGEFASIPRSPGTYVVYRAPTDPPVFLTPGTGGWFKDADPNVTVERLRANWVSGARVVYIGKATTLRSRLRAYARFGAGKPVGHRGGRLIWQLAGAPSLLVAWRELADPAAARDDEARLLARFRELHGGVLPFANLVS